MKTFAHTAYLCFICRLLLWHIETEAVVCCFFRVGFIRCQLLLFFDMAGMAWMY